MILCESSPNSLDPIKTICTKSLAWLLMFILIKDFQCILVFSSNSPTNHPYCIYSTMRVYFFSFTADEQTLILLITAELFVERLQVLPISSSKYIFKNKGLNTIIFELYACKMMVETNYNNMNHFV